MKPQKLFSDASGWAECSTTTIAKRRDKELMRLSRDHLWSANAGALGTSVEACQLEATEARGKPLPMLRPGLKSYFEGGGDFAEDSKGKCVHTLVFVFLD